MIDHCASSPPLLRACVCIRAREFCASCDLVRPTGSAIGVLVRALSYRTYYTRSKRFCASCLYTHTHTCCRPTHGRQHYTRTHKYAHTHARARDLMLLGVRTAPNSLHNATAARTHAHNSVWSARVHCEIDKNSPLARACTHTHTYIFHSYVLRTGTIVHTNTAADGCAAAAAAAVCVCCEWPECPSARGLYEPPFE